jgi:hypothetical protein
LCMEVEMDKIRVFHNHALLEIIKIYN